MSIAYTPVTSSPDLQLLESWSIGKGGYAVVATVGTARTLLAVVSSRGKVRNLWPLLPGGGLLLYWLPEAAMHSGPRPVFIVTGLKLPFHA